MLLQNPCTIQESEKWHTKYNLFTYENHTWKKATPVQAAHCTHRKYVSEAQCVGPIYHLPFVYNISCSTEV